MVCIRGLFVILFLCAGCNLSTTEVATLPTATNTVEPTLARATRTPITLPNEVRPTPLGVLSTLPPPPIVGTSPTQIGAVTTAVTPDQAVRDYYALVSQGRYDLSWAQLSDTFKQKFNCCAPDYNYADYVQWWDSVNTVEFNEVSVLSQNGDRAVVYVQMTYLMNNGQRSPVVNDPYIELRYDTALNNWRFEDKRATA